MTKHLLALFLFVGGFASTATSQDLPVQGASQKVETGPGPYNVNLDAASGNYEERFLQVPADGFTIKGFMQFTVVRADPKWEPLAAVEVMGPKGSFFAGLIAFVRPKTDKIEFAVRDERLLGLPDASFGRIALTDKAIPFELRLDRSGVLQASVLGKSGRAVSVRPVEITRVRLLASTGHIRFLDVDVVASDK